MKFVTEAPEGRIQIRSSNEHCLNSYTRDEAKQIYKELTELFSVVHLKVPVVECVCGSENLEVIEDLPAGIATLFKCNDCLGEFYL